jgi:hypothetical protein
VHRSGDPDHLVVLEAEAPFGVSKAVGDRGFGILAKLRAVHRLEEEMVEGEMLEPFGIGEGLRIDKL